MPGIAIGVRLQQIFAAIGDPHSNVSMKYFLDKKKNLPIEVYWFDDGLYITKASEEHKRALGSKIKQINNHDIGIVIDSLSTLLVQDNPSINKAYLPFYLNAAEILEYFGFVD